MKLSLLISLVQAQFPNIKELNAQVIAKTKQFWLDQFQPWETTGFTSDMILGAKEVYHADDYFSKTDSLLQLWTVIDGDIYLERGPDYQDNKANHAFIEDYADTMDLVIRYGKMPSKIQFWGRTYPDDTDFTKYDGRRLDLLHPVIWFDNQPSTQNLIVLPDTWMMVKYMDQIINCMCINDNNVPWEQKVDKVYFAGKLTGWTYDEDGKYINRLKMVHIATENPDMFEVHPTNPYDYKYDEHAKKSWGTKLEDIPEIYRDDLSFHEDLCTRMDMKYLIHIDGHASSWGRGPAILYSDSVLLEVESNFTPLYMKSFIPWVHYVPIQSDLEDLVEKIEWLRAHDDEAKQIALNGKQLYQSLYLINNITEDAGTVFQTYASMMKYEPERPDEEFRFKKWKLGTKHKRIEDRVEEDEVYVVEDDEEFDEDGDELNEDL